jgi:hypothetical protein
MDDQFEGGCLYGAVRFCGKWSAEVGGVVPLPKLSEA